MITRFYNTTIRQKKKNYEKNLTLMLTHPFETDLLTIFSSLWRSQNYNFSPCFSILCSNSIIIFCSRWYWWCYYFLKGTHPQLCKFLPQSLKASFKVCRLQKVHVPHSQQQIFFCQNLFLFPKNFSFQKLLQNTYFLENYLISMPCQNELTRLLSMYSSLLSTVWWKKNLMSQSKIMSR